MFNQPYSWSTWGYLANRIKFKPNKMESGVSSNKNGNQATVDIWAGCYACCPEMDIPQTCPFHWGNNTFQTKHAGSGEFLMDSSNHERLKTRSNTGRRLHRYFTCHKTWIDKLVLQLEWDAIPKSTTLSHPSMKRELALVWPFQFLGIQEIQRVQNAFEPPIRNFGDCDHFY